MCGRFAITLPPEAIRAYFAYVERPNFPPRANIAPTQPVPIVRLARNPDGAKRRHFALVRWSFLPAFVKDPKEFPLVINARSETVFDKPSFRNAARRRRCIFIADAFYEWRRPPKPAKGKAPAAQPFLIRRRDGSPMALAGLWETWVGPDGEELDGACVLTTDANALVASVHDRMPVILEREDFDAWLDCDETDVSPALRLMKPCGDDVLEMWPISAAVNKVANDAPDLQTPVGPIERADTPRRAQATPPRQGDLFG